MYLSCDQVFLCVQHRWMHVKFENIYYQLTERGIEDAEYITADINVQKSLNQMCMRSSVIIDCVGPVSCCACLKQCVGILQLISCNQSCLLYMIAEPRHYGTDEIVVFILILLGCIV